MAVRLGTDWGDGDHRRLSASAAPEREDEVVWEHLNLTHQIPPSLSISLTHLTRIAHIAYARHFSQRCSSALPWLAWAACCSRANSRILLRRGRSPAPDLRTL